VYLWCADQGTPLSSVPKGRTALNLLQSPAHLLGSRQGGNAGAGASAGAFARVGVPLDNMEEGVLLGEERPGASPRTASPHP